MDNFIDKFAHRKNAQEMIRANAMAEAKEREKLAEKLSEYEAALQEMRRCNLQNLENAEKVKELLAASLSRIEEAQGEGGRDGVAPEQTAEEMKVLFAELAGQITKLLDEQKERTEGLFKRQQSWMAELLERQQSWMAGLVEKQQAQTVELFGAQEERTAEALEWQLVQLEELFAEQKGQLVQLEELFTEQKGQVSEALERQQARTEELFAEQKKEAEDFGHKEAVKVYRNVQAVIEGALPKQTAELTDALKADGKKEGAPKGLFALGVLTFLAAAGSAVIEVLRMLGYV